MVSLDIKFGLHAVDEIRDGLEKFLMVVNWRHRPSDSEFGGNRYVLNFRHPNRILQAVAMSIHKSLTDHGFITETFDPDFSSGHRILLWVPIDNRAETIRSIKTLTKAGVALVEDLVTEALAKYPPPIPPPEPEPVPQPETIEQDPESWRLSLQQKLEQVPDRTRVAADTKKPPEDDSEGFDDD